MPPRYAYWTILIGDEPTAFRAGALEDIMPTFNRLKEKQPNAILKWFQNGKLWTSRIEAREAMAFRGDKGRRRDPNQSTFAPGASVDKGGWRGKPAISDPKPTGGGGPLGSARAKPEWKPKTAFSSPRPQASSREARPAWKPKADGVKPAWRPKAEGFSRGAKPEWKPKSGARPNWKPSSFARPDRGRATEDKKAARPDWKPRAEETRTKPEWKPKASPRLSSTVTGRSDVRDKKWRPGGEHQDPRQKYKDAKKAKWTRFKQAIRARTGHKKKPE